MHIADVIVIWMLLSADRQYELCDVGHRVRPLITEVRLSMLYRLRKVDASLTQKNTVAHDDRTWDATERKILKKIDGLATLIELPLAI